MLIIHGNTMKRITLLWLVLSAFFSLYAQDSFLLRGGGLCSTPVDYNDGGGLRSGQLVFDGNYETFYASNERSYTWVGLDLGTPHVITKLGYAPRNDWAKRLLLGVIEGANREDFMDAVPLYVISEIPKEKVMTEADIICSKGFRYIRYVGPNDVRCNIAELAFYGYASKGDDTRYYLPSGLPVVTIHTVNSEDIIEKEKYLEGIVSILSNEETKIFTTELNVRGRGNASWQFPKKPYRMKFNSKNKILNFPAKAKNWTLINNYGDKTLMRNMVAFEISRRFNMEYTSVNRPVDVFLNGEYKGCYQLCDQMEVDKNRVNVTEMASEDVALPELSGGYFIEIDAYADQEISWFKSKQKQIPVTIKSPKDDEIVPAQTKYITDYFNQLEERLFAADYKDENKGFRSVLDTKSFLKHFLIGELCGNTDTYWSVYMYKERGEDLFYTGPVWDFDIAFNNDDRIYPIENRNEYICLNGGSCANGMHAFINRILSDEKVKEELSEIWSEARHNGNITEESLLAYIDSCALNMDQSQKLNFTRWNILNQRVHQNPRVAGSYTGEVGYVKDYMKKRLKWMDNKVGLKAPVSIDKNASNEGNIYVSGSFLKIEGFKDAVSYHVWTSTGVSVYSGTNFNDLALPSGIYLINITKVDKSIFRQKIVI